MRKLIIAGLAAGFMTLAIAPAFASPNGPGGTSEGHADPADPAVWVDDNNVNCGTTGTALPDGSVVATDGTTGGTGGALILCNDSGPIQGRIILAGDATKGGYVAADGDKDNPSGGTGWSKVTIGADNPGPSCGDNDSTTEAGRMCSAP